MISSFEEALFRIWVTCAKYRHEALIRYYHTMQRKHMVHVQSTEALTYLLQMNSDGINTHDRSSRETGLFGIT